MCPALNRRLFSVAFALALPLSALSAQAQEVRADIVASNLQNPWAVAFLPDGRFLVTERTGRLRLLTADGKAATSVAGLPEIEAGGQGGLLDLITDSDFARNRLLYFCYSEPAGFGRTNSTALASARLSSDGSQLENLKVIFSQKPKVSSSAHFGCRIVEGRLPGIGGLPDGKLFLTLGDRFSRKDDAQKLDNHHGKIVRINKDGSVPADNPFVGKTDARPEIWSYGPQCARCNPCA